MIKFVVLVSLFLSANAFAETGSLDNVSLKVSSSGNSDIVNCIVEESMKAYPEYDLFNVSGAIIVDSSTQLDQDRFAKLVYLAKHKETGKLERIRTVIESLDEDKKWFYVQDSSNVFPFTHKASDFATATIEQPESPALFVLLENCGNL